ncbi:MAG: peptidoglycan-binding domain-containing protein, partial [bacterium]
MSINILKKGLSATIMLAMIITTTFGLNDTKAIASTTADVNSNLNTATETFVNRLNQIPQNFIFNQNLKRGTPVSPDVQYLKWVLNSDTRTALTDNPNMTMNELTSAFGPLTEDAVKRFQTVYRSEILDPQGIANATGVVGKGTRQKLNSLLTKSRLVTNYSNVLNTALTQRMASSDYSSNNNYNNTSGNTNTVDFSYLNPLNLDAIFSSYTATEISTSTTQYSEASALAASSSDSSLNQDNNQTANDNNTNTQTSTSTNTDTASTTSATSTTGTKTKSVGVGGTVGGTGSNTDPNAILSKSPAPGVLAPYTVIGVTALISGDFVGAAVASYLSGKGGGASGIKGLVSDYASTLSMGKVGSSATVSKSGSNSSGSTGGGSSGGLLLAGGALAAGGMM